MGKPTVLIVDGIHPIAKDVLKEECDVIYEPKLPKEELHKYFSSINALMVRSGIQVNKAVLEQAPDLRIIGRAGVGTDNIDIKAATRKGIIVVNSPGGNTIAAAEHTIGMLMAMARHIPQADRVVKSGGWRSKDLVGVELFGKTLGVIGFGKIGRRVAMAFQRMEMRVVVYDPFLSVQMADELKVELVDLNTLLGESDFITIHVPKTPETSYIIDANAFAKMKDGVRIVNCARGGIINEADMLEAIQANKVAAVSLDVFDHEPLPADDPLLKLGDKIIVTPHLGASTEEAQVNVARDVAEQFLEYFQTGAPKNAVNIPSLRREILEPVECFMPMAESIGNLIRQISPGGINQVELVASGTISKENLMPLTLAVLKGLLGHAREGINYVNAMVIAEEEGISVKESRSPKAGNYLNLLTVRLVMDKGVHSVSASLIADKIYRIVELDGYPANIEPSRYILLTPHVDKPGMIAKVATLLGENQINVSALQVARKGVQAGGESMMIFNLDNPVNSELIKNIEKIEGIISATFIELPYDNYS